MNVIMLNVVALIFLTFYQIVWACAHEGLIISLIVDQQRAKEKKITALNTNKQLLDEVL